MASDDSSHNTSWADTDHVLEILESFYGLHVQTTRKIRGYYGVNFHVTVADKWENAGISELSESGYLLKINKYDLAFKKHAEAEECLQREILARGLKCPSHIPTTDGRTLVLLRDFTPNPRDTKDENDALYIVRLQTFISGTTVDKVPSSPSLMYSAGRYLARLHLALQGFSHEAFRTFDLIWCLKNVPKLSDYLIYVRDKDRCELVTRAIDEFCENVTPKYRHFSTGTIHGDFSAQNVIVREMENNNNVADDYRVCATIDFEHTAECCHVFDVGISLAYMTLTSREMDPLAIPGYYLAGYLSTRSLSDEELSAIWFCIVARYAQSLVMGEYNHSRDPENSYILTTAGRGWDLLARLLDTDPQQLTQQWLDTARSLTPTSTTAKTSLTTCPQDTETEQRIEI